MPCGVHERGLDRLLLGDERLSLYVLKVSRWELRLSSRMEVGLILDLLMVSGWILRLRRGLKLGLYGRLELSGS